MKHLTGQAIAQIAAVVSGLVFTSCMHALMEGGMGGHENHAGSHPAMEATLEKEVIVGDMKATAVLPSVELEKETVLVLRLSDSKTGEPIRRAKVYAHVEFQHSPGTHPGMDHDAMTDSSSEMKAEASRGAEFQQEVGESSTAGAYSFAFKAHRPGTYTITFHVTEIGGQTLSPALMIEANRTVTEGEQQHRGMGMFGMRGSTTYVILGTVVMGAMMLMMWLVGGSIF